MACEFEHPWSVSRCPTHDIGDYLHVWHVEAHFREASRVSHVLGSAIADDLDEQLVVCQVHDLPRSVVRGRPVEFAEPKRRAVPLRG